MAVLIDPPLWPAHGTTFSHLVSDSSLDELHAFAQVQGIPDRAFDRDHYDVAAREHDRLVRAGAVPVSAGELTRRLLASPLRVRARDRADRHDAWLRQRFGALLPGAPDSVEDLLRRWGHSSRNYHDKRHLADVLRGIDRLTQDESAPGPAQRETRQVAELAGWWHDAVYEGVTGDDEHHSAQLASEMLAGTVPASTLFRVQEAIEMTASHEPGDDPAQALLSDADLRVLARPPRSYARYVADVRRDYAHVSDGDFALGRAQVLQTLLATDRLFATRLGHDLWETAARENLTRELLEHAGWDLRTDPTG
jgi:predicted metal-dependent HD superfamily phosphohydrolase